MAQDHKIALTRSSDRVDPAISSKPASDKAICTNKPATPPPPSSECLHRVKYQLLLRDELREALNFMDLDMRVIGKQERQACELVASLMPGVVDTHLWVERAEWEQKFTTIAEIGPAIAEDADLDFDPYLQLAARPEQFIDRIIGTLLDADQKLGIARDSVIAQIVRDTKGGQETFIAYLTTVWGFHRAEYLKYKITCLLYECPQCRTRIKAGQVVGLYKLYCVCLPPDSVVAATDPSVTDVVKAVCDISQQRMISQLCSLPYFTLYRNRTLISSADWESIRSAARRVRTVGRSRKSSLSLSRTSSRVTKNVARAPIAGH